MSPPRSFPVQAMLLFAGATIALRLATSTPFRFPLLTPDLLGAALFLYLPFLYYRKGRAPSWVRLAGAKRSAVLFLALGTAGAVAFLLVTLSSFSPFPAFSGSEPPPLGAFALRQALLVALPEEVFFRGYLYDAFEEAGWEPVTASALLFAVGHLVIQASAYRALTFFPALLFGWGRKQSGNIYVPVFLHLLFNLFPHLAGAM